MMLESEISKKVPIVIDSDPAFLQNLKDHPLAKETPLEMADNGKLGRIFLMNTSKKYSSVFINFELSNRDAFSVVRYAHRYRPEIPKFFIFDTENSRIPEEEIKKLGLQGMIVKPVDFAGLLDFQKSLDYERTLVVRKVNEEVGKDLFFDTTEFIPILADHFVSGNRTFFDLYVRLSSNRCVKILHAGEVFSVDRLESYLKKGVQWFYIRKEVQEDYLNYCDYFSKKMINSDKSNQNINININRKYKLNQGVEIFKFLEGQSVHPAQLNSAVELVRSVTNWVADIRQEIPDNPFLHAFISDIQLYEHNIGNTLIAAMLGEKAGIVSGPHVEALGLTSFLHDIGLQRLPFKLESEDVERMSAQEKASFFSHPILGADIVRSFPGIDPIVVQSIAQHHERKDHSGFPKKIGLGSINRMAELVGISDEFLHLIKKSQMDPQLDAVSEMLKKIPSLFSEPVVDAFREIFVEKK